MPIRLAAAVVSILFLWPGLGAQTVDEIVSRHLAAIGGVERIKSLDSVRVQGRIVAAGGRTGKATLLRSRPNKVRFGIEMSGAEMVQAYDGQDAWRLTPKALGGTGRPHDMPEHVANSFVARAGIDSLLLEYKEKGRKVELLGKVESDVSSLFHLRVTESGGGVTDLYLDTKRYLLIERVFRTYNRHIRKQIEIKNVYGDYREVEGIPTSHSWQQWAQGALTWTIKLDKVEWNPKLDDKLFRRPE